MLQTEVRHGVKVLVKLKLKSNNVSPKKHQNANDFWFQCGSGLENLSKKKVNVSFNRQNQIQTKKVFHDENGEGCCLQSLSLFYKNW